MADQNDDDQTPPEDGAAAAAESDAPEAPEAAETTAEATEEAAAEESAPADGVEVPADDAGEMLQLFGTLMQKLGRAAQSNRKTTDGGGIPKGVTEMITKVVEQVRDKSVEATKDARRLADNVVDLETERRKREAAREPTAFESKFQSTLKEAFSEYVEENLVGEENGERVVRVDLELVKDHGLALGAHLLRSLADGLVPDEYRVNMPAGAPEGDGDEGPNGATAEGENDEAAEGDGVAIEFDLQSFFKRWIAPRPAPPEGD